MSQKSKGEKASDGSAIFWWAGRRIRPEVADPVRKQQGPATELGTDMGLYFGERKSLFSSLRT